MKDYKDCRENQFPTEQKGCKTMLIVLLIADGMLCRNCYMTCCRETAEEATYFVGQRTK